MAGHRKVSAGIAALLLAIGAPTAFAVSWTWSGAGPDGNWSTDANWVGGIAPASVSSDTLMFTDTGVRNHYVSNGWTVGALDVTNVTGTHITGLGGNRLTVDNAGGGSCAVGHRMASSAWTVTNGTLQLGTSSRACDLYLGVREDWTFPSSQGILTLSNAVLDANLGKCYVGWAGESSGNGELDLLNATLTNGVFTANDLEAGMAAYSWVHGLIKFSAASGLTNLVVRSTLKLGSGNGGYGRIGDPNDSYRLPTNVNLTLGSWGTTRCAVTIGQHAYPWVGPADGQLVAATGGVCTAYLGAVDIAPDSSVDPQTDARNALGTLDLRNMTNITADIQALNIVNSTYQKGKGYVYLPPGNVTVKDVLVCASGLTNGTYVDAKLQLNGTVFTVTNSLAIGPRGVVEVRVAATPGGLDLAMPGDPTFSSGGSYTGRISIVFTQGAASDVRVLWGLRWAGDHVAALTALNQAGKVTLAWDAGVPPAQQRALSIFYTSGSTYAGLSLKRGTVITIK